MTLRFSQVKGCISVGRFNNVICFPLIDPILYSKLLILNPITGLLRVSGNSWSTF